MKLTDIQNRILKLESRIPTVDECALVTGAMMREHYLSHGQTCPPHVLDSSLDTLAMQESLPVGTSSLITVAWEILRNPGSVYEAIEA